MTNVAMRKTRHPKTIVKECGVWRTFFGVSVFVNKGSSLDQAMKDAGLPLFSDAKWLRIMINQW